MTEIKPKKQRGGSVFLGLVLLVFGLVLLAQRLGWIPNQIDWLFPSLLIAWGFSELYRGLQS